MDWGIWTIFWLLGALVGFGVGIAVTIFKIDRKRELRESALRRISHYKWGTGVNDAAVITRIAIKGMNGND